MHKMQWDIEIKLFLLSNTLVIYPDEDMDEFIENPHLKIIIEYLNIDIGIIDWYNRCIQIAIGKMELQKIEIHYCPD